MAYSYKIVEKLNTDLRKLGAGPLSGLPEVSFECGCLSDKKVVIIDDSAQVIASFLPYLQSITGGRASYILHLGQSKGEVVSEIASKGVDLLLLDANLAKGLKGYDIAEAVVQIDPGIVLVGFSSDPGTEKLFIDNGVHEFVVKRVDRVRESLDQVCLRARNFFINKA